MKKTIKTLLLLSLVACNSKGGGGGGKKNGGGTNSSPESNSISTTQPESLSTTLDVSVRRKVSYDFESKNSEDFKSNINTFKIKLKPKDEFFSNMDVTCKQNSLKGDIYTARFDERGEEAEVELKVPEQGPNQVKFICQVRQDGSVFASAEINLRKSIVVAGLMNFTALGLDSGEIETLYLEKDSVLITSGSDVKIKMKEIISENGKIMTFSDKEISSTPMAVNGLNGGRIALKTKKSFGDLKIELRGTNGGAVSVAKMPKADSKPVNPSLNSRCSTMNKSEIGKHKVIMKCRGKDGSKGLSGSDGENGYKGGNSGELQFQGNFSETFKLDVIYLPGKGSVAGEGGEGGEGEPGGRGAKIKVRETPISTPNRFPAYSYEFPSGYNGPQGDKGKKGFDGISGERLESVIELDSKKYSIFDSNLF